MANEGIGRRSDGEAVATRAILLGERLEPLAAMEAQGRVGAHAKEPIRHIGDVLRVQYPDDRSR